MVKTIRHGRVEKLQNHALIAGMIYGDTKASLRKVLTAIEIVKESGKAITLKKNIQTGKDTPSPVLGAGR